MRRRLKGIFGGCFALVILSLIVFTFVTWRATVALDRRAAPLQGEIEAFRSSLPVQRAPRFGPPTDGNAADDYRAIEAFLAERGGARPDLDPLVPLRKLLRTTREKRQACERVPDEAADAVREYGGVISRVRLGLSRPRCDWSPPFERGCSVPVPDVQSARCAAELLALDAQLDPDGRSAIRTGLEIIAYGEDHVRHGTLIGVMVGIALQGMGVGSLEHTMRTRKLPREAYEEVLSTLATVEPVDLRGAFEADRLAINVELAKLTSRGFGEPGNQDLRSLRFFGPVFFAREWAGYEAYMARYREAVLLPAKAREAALETIDRDLAGSWLIIARIALPNLGESGDHIDTARAMLELTRMLAAAHLHRLDTGSFPREGAALATYLGGSLPADPFKAGAALSYRTTRCAAGRSAATSSTRTERGAGRRPRRWS